MARQDAGWIPTRWAQFFTGMAGENGVRTSEFGWEVGLAMVDTHIS